MILSPFDPWRGSLCTCPPKHSLNPYTGCPHGCLYCYASYYIPRFPSCRPKRDLLRRLSLEVQRVDSGTLVAMANSSDPYPPQEKTLRLTRGCLEILRARGLSVQIVTKSDLVAQDAQLLAEMRACVSVTVTTLDRSVSSRLEPGAPTPDRRLSAISELSEMGVPVSARIDPLIPGINDREIEELVAAVGAAGALHVTSSSYKPPPGNLRRISSAFPEEAAALEGLFSKKSAAVGRLLPEGIRFEMLERVRKNAQREGMTFSTCREGISPTAGVNCDGSHLLSMKVYLYEE